MPDGLYGTGLNEALAFKLQGEMVRTEKRLSEHSDELKTNSRVNAALEKTQNILALQMRLNELINFSRIRSRRKECLESINKVLLELKKLGVEDYKYPFTMGELDELNNDGLIANKKVQTF